MNRKNYLLNLTYQSNISELEKCTPDLVLESNRLQFVGGGLDHVVFSNSNVDDQVVIFKRMSQNSNENEQPNQKFVIDMMETVYETVMNRKFSAINKYRWQKTRMYIYNHTPQQINQFFIKLQNILKQKVQLDEIVIPEIQNLSLDRTYAVVQISKNIFKVGEYNTYVEFKPKSILPDLFSERMIEENSIKFGKTVTEIKQILKKGDPVQKTRWFKKNMLKVKEKQKNDSSHDTKKTKINQNPLHIFNIGPQNKQVPNFIKTKLLKILPSLNDNEEQLLNATIFEQIHSQKQLIQIIHQIQSIYPYSPDFINTQINYNLLDGSKRDKASMCKILQNQIKSIMEQVQIKSLDDMYSHLLNCDCVSEVPKKLHPEGTEEQKQFQNLSNFLLFLISLSWKDISLVYRSKFNGSEFEQAQIWIIDDYLKNFNKVLKNIEKDESLLKKYIKFKLEQNHP